jgi:hypothetical protein
VTAVAASEQQLVLAAQRGEPHAHAQLIERFSPQIASVAGNYRRSTGVKRSELMHRPRSAERRTCRGRPIRSAGGRSGSMDSGSIGSPERVVKGARRSVSCVRTAVTADTVSR